MNWDGSDEIAEAIENHRLWLADEETGNRMDFTNGNLEGCDFSGADLRMACFAAADCRGADFSGSNLSSAYFWRSDLRDCDFGFSNLFLANMKEVDARCANFSHADLQKADLSGSHLREASFHNANLRNTDLKDANLYRASLLCFGNGREINTMQLGSISIGYTAEDLQINGVHVPISEWREWVAHPEQPTNLPTTTEQWCRQNLGLLLSLIANNPAAPTNYSGSHEEDNKDENDNE